MSTHRIGAFLAVMVSAAAASAPPPAAAQIAITVSVADAPPPLPVYVQPAIPAVGYLWEPGYWSWDPEFGYYWVPGTWVLPPRQNLLWTPGYWGWNNGSYVFNQGYWATEVGFYGGVSYGYGYGGDGYQGGFWNSGAFYYNRSANNIVNLNTTNVYTKTVIVNQASNVSYNGGSGGIVARATPQQVQIARQQVAPTPAQAQQASLARTNPVLRLSNNHGAPPIAATPRPAVFQGAGVVAAAPVASAQHPAGVSATQANVKRLPVPQGVSAAHALPAPTNRATVAPNGPATSPAHAGVAVPAADRTKAKQLDEQQHHPLPPSGQAQHVPADHATQDQHAQQAQQAAREQQVHAQQEKLRLQQQLRSGQDQQRRLDQQKASQDQQRAQAAQQQQRAIQAQQHNQEEQHARQQEQRPNRPECGRPGQPPCR